MQQAVAARDHTALRVHHGAVERVQHRAHERARRAGRQARVGVERQQVHRTAQARRVPGRALQRARPVEHQPRQLQQCAALALPRAPFPVGCGHPLAREEIKPAAPARVERGDLRARRAQDGGVDGRVRHVRLRQVGQQAERELPERVAVAEIVLLQPRAERVRIVRGGEQRCNHAQRPPLRRDAPAQRQPRHEARLRHAQQHRVEQTLDHLRHRDEQQHRARHAFGRKAQQQRQKQRPHHDGRDVPPAVAATFRRAEHLAQQKPAHVPPRALAALCAREHVLGDLNLRPARPPRQPRRDLPVVRARGRVHRGVDAHRVAREDAPHAVAPLGEHAPRRRAECAQGGEERGRGRAVMGIALRQRAHHGRLQPRHEQGEFRRLERQHVLKPLQIRLRRLDRQRALTCAQQPRTARAQRRLPARRAHARVPQGRRGIARSSAGKAPVVAQPLAVRRLGRDGARHARERFRCAPDAPGVRAAPAGHGQGAGVAPALCAQGGSVGFGHEDPSRNGLQYRNFSHPAGNLCGDKKKYLTPARPWRILLVL